MITTASRRRPGASKALCILTSLFFSAAIAQDIDCGECHAGVTFASPVHHDLNCSDCHTNVSAEHAGDDLEPLTDADSCGQCHRSENRNVGRSVHKGEAACIDCHTGPHTISAVDDPASSVSAVNQIPNCRGCHNDPESLVDGYLGGVHGRGLLASGLADSASCSDCHGAHDIDPVSDDSAATSHAHSPEMCGQCHSLLLATWKTGSAHGHAWLNDNAEGPVCTDCHSSHAISEPWLDASRLESAEKCGGCHQEYLTTFRDSFHGKANELGFVEGATCADCHTPHENLPASHPDSSVHPDNLIATCGACHEGINASFVTFEPHNDPSDPDDNFRIYVVYVFMMGLLIGVFAFFGLHDVLWLQRQIVGAIRGEFDEDYEGDGRYVRRFSKMNIRMHIVIIVTFLLLALTGLPLKFHDAAWAHNLITLLGGVDSSRFLHRLAGIGTFGYALFHLGNLFIRFAIKREPGMLWGPNSMVPQPRDVMDVLANLRYFLYLGERPASDRWNYIEKFDYLAVFWGVMIIGLSGLILWFPAVFASILPGWMLNAAYVIHSDEALLATGFIFFFHFFHTHLRPESFPMDTVIFTGKLSLKRFKVERPLEYQRLVDNNELEQYLVDPPTADERRSAYVWGTIFLITGIALAIGIVWALLSH